ncbi:hypothetical protein DQ384_39375 [Sphaerisporangium album]|uniref:Uncharacterized protein n=1 Tax=Sphaerisporangium album TaxID=509200 RepID=A0A367EKK6_9ACTN|nr:hypothetical protein [Sphaerisporangium album]RCG17907.1 hypothetical protein DQ384_39375 [Sphaerisporangium album]
MTASCRSGAAGEQAGGRLAAAAILRMMAAGVLDGRHPAAVLESADDGTRAALALLRDFLLVADTRRELVPVVAHLGRGAAAALAAIYDEDRAAVSAWLDGQARIAVDHAESWQGLGRPIPLVIDLVATAAAELWDEAAAGQTPGRLAAQLNAWIRPDHLQQDRYELLLCLGHYTADLTAHAMRYEADPLYAYLDAVAARDIGHGT